MSISGNGLEVNGGAHSNGDVTIDGENSDCEVITLVEDEVEDNVLQQLHREPDAKTIQVTATYEVT